MYTCTKRFTNLPFAHRQHNHDGHCALIHGHNWDFELEFEADTLSKELFVVDFGKLKWLRRWLEERFDHTLVLNRDDPHLEELMEKLCPAHSEAEPDPLWFAKIVVVPNGGAEGLAYWVFCNINDVLSVNPEMAARGVRVRRVTVFEDEKNSATYQGS